MPSKRTFADKLNVSVITVQQAYDQLISEGYVYSKERKGYFVAELLEEWHEMNTMVEEMPMDSPALQAVYPFRGQSPQKRTVSGLISKRLLWKMNMRKWHMKCCGIYVKLKTIGEIRTSL